MIFNLVILFVTEKAVFTPKFLQPFFLPPFPVSKQRKEGGKSSPAPYLEDFESAFLKRGQILAADVLSETPLAD